jgi:hypothetical protein
VVTKASGHAIMRASRLFLVSQMEIRALMQTRKRKRAMLLLAFAVFGVAMWVFLGGGRNLSEEEKYQRMVRSRDWASLMSRRRFPTAIQNLLGRVEDRLFARFIRQEGELVASGYLVCFPVTNTNDWVNLRTRLGTTTNYWRTHTEWTTKSNAVFVICRSNDAPRIRALVEKQP